MKKKDKKRENGKEQPLNEEEQLEKATEEDAVLSEDKPEFQKEQAPGAGEGERKEELPPEEEKEGKRKSRVGRFFRKLLIWLVVIAVSFGAGIGAFYYLRHQPLQERVEQQASDLQDARAEIGDLQNEIDRLSAFEERNYELTQEIEQTRLHITILSARSSVADALLALSEDNLAEAKLELDKVDKTLDTLETMLNEDQVEVVKNMQQRHELIMEELEDDTFSARSDLEVLSSKLGSLENTLFATP